jgi:hypothetical protein
MEWTTYIAECEEKLNTVSSMNNVIALNVYLDPWESVLIGIKSDGTICTTDSDSDLNYWSNIKTSEKSNKLTSKVNKETEVTIKDSTKYDDTSEASEIYEIYEKDDVSETSESNSNNKFFEKKYYSFCDENGESNIDVFQLYDYCVKVTIYDATVMDDTPTYEGTYDLQWNDDYTYAENDLGMKFIIDYNSMTVEYKDSEMESFTTLIEFDDLDIDSIRTSLFSCY